MNILKINSKEGIWDYNAVDGFIADTKNLALQGQKEHFSEGEDSPNRYLHTVMSLMHVGSVEAIKLTRKEIILVSKK